jgi:hypothetical protein
MTKRIVGDAAMPVREPKYSNEEAARRGSQLYDQQVRPRLTAADNGRFVAIDMDSGQWEIDVDEIAAEERLLSRLPDAQIWIERVGFDYTERFGSCRAEGNA